MPQYKVVYRFPDKDSTYIKHGSSLESFSLSTECPTRIIDGQVFSGDFVKAEEMEIFATFQLDEAGYLEEIENTAKSLGLQAYKAAGAYCLTVRGMGDWIKSGWVPRQQILNSNWQGDL